MKKSTILALIAASTMIVPRSGAVWTDAETWSAGGSLMIDSDSILGTDIQSDFYLGQYIQDSVMVGGYVNIGDNDFITRVSGGATCKFHFFDNGHNLFSPYIGAQLGAAYAEAADDDAYALTLGGSLGLDYFLSPQVALNVSLNASVASDDVYTDDEGLTGTDINIRAGLGFFF